MKSSSGVDYQPEVGRDGVGRCCTSCPAFVRRLPPDYFGTCGARTLQIWDPPSPPIHPRTIRDLMCIPWAMEAARALRAVEILETRKWDLVVDDAGGDDHSGWAVYESGTSVWWSQGHATCIDAVLAAEEAWQKKEAEEQKGEAEEVKGSDNVNE